MAGGLIRICYQLQNTLTPLFGGVLGLSASAVGVLTTISTVTSLVLRPWLGGALDRYGRRTIVLIGTLLFALATALCGLAGGFAVLAVLRAFQGLGFSAHTTAVNTLATDLLPEARMTEGIGYMGLTSSVSLAIAPGIAVMLFEGGDFGLAYGLAGAVGLFAFACLLCVRRQSPAQPIPQNDQTDSAEAYQGWQRFWEKNAIKPALIMLLLGTCYAALFTFLATYALNAGFSAAQVGAFFTVNAIATAVARMLGGRTAQRIGTRSAMALASCMSIAGFLLLAAARGAASLFVAAALHGLAYGLIYPLLNAMAITQSPPNRRGTAMSTFLTAMDIGLGFGASLWGLFIDSLGIEHLFFACAILALAVYGGYRLLLDRAAQRTT
jgi:predicted MFS family arabinose efflux permease